MRRKSIIKGFFGIFIAISCCFFTYATAEESIEIQKSRSKDKKIEELNTSTKKFKKLEFVDAYRRNLFKFKDKYNFDIKFNLDNKKHSLVVIYILKQLLEQQILVDIGLFTNDKDAMYKESDIAGGQDIHYDGLYDLFKAGQRGLSELKVQCTCFSKKAVEKLKDAIKSGKLQKAIDTYIKKIESGEFDEKIKKSFVEIADMLRTNVQILETWREMSKKQLKPGENKSVAEKRKGDVLFTKFERQWLSEHLPETYKIIVEKENDLEFCEKVLNDMDRTLLKKIETGEGNMRYSVDLESKVFDLFDSCRERSADDSKMFEKIKKMSEEDERKPRYNYSLYLHNDKACESLYGESKASLGKLKLKEGLIDEIKNIFKSLKVKDFEEDKEYQKLHPEFKVSLEVMRSLGLCFKYLKKEQLVVVRNELSKKLKEVESKQSEEQYEKYGKLVLEAMYKKLTDEELKNKEVIRRCGKIYIEEFAKNLKEAIAKC